MDRWPDDISTRPDDLNILTRQSADMNNAPREPFHGPVEWNHACTLPDSTLHLRLCYWHIRHRRNLCYCRLCITNLQKYASFIWHEFCH